MVQNCREVPLNACAWIDIDNDGDLDLYVSAISDKQYLLFVNDGTGIFTEEALKRGLGNVPKLSRCNGFPTAGDQ